MLTGANRRRIDHLLITRETRHAVITFLFIAHRGLHVIAARIEVEKAERWYNLTDLLSCGSSGKPSAVCPDPVVLWKGEDQVEVLDGEETSVGRHIGGCLVVQNGVFSVVEGTKTMIMHG
jgi:hypothetical protein